MAKIIEQDKKLKERIGAFVIAFSEMEYGLAELANLCEPDLRKLNERLSITIGLPIERKRKIISKFVKSDMQELFDQWKKIDKEIDEINQYRRLIIHGIFSYYLPNEDLKGVVQRNGQLQVEDIKAEEIHSYTQRIHHVKSGENGILGTFHFKFKKLRVDRWNDLVQDQHKIIYKRNNKIESEWKG